MTLLTLIAKVPHAFQHILSAEKTPTLCHTIPAFEAFIQRWKELSAEQPGFRQVIAPGLEKLEDYRDRTEQTPAYVVAMGNHNFSYNTRD